MPDRATIAAQIDRAAGPLVPCADRVVLGYDARFLRRRRLVGAAGLSFLVDLPETVSVEAGDCFVLGDGRRVRVIAADEDVLRIEGDLARLAWHIGNRHTPCQIMPDHLLIRRDHVLEAMLRQLGATVLPTIAPFTPEGGAYGHGRTMGHDHGPAGHDHGPTDESGPFGHFHDHGDGHVHFHPAPAARPAPAAVPDLPFGHLHAKG